MATKISGHRYGTKLHHCHPIYIAALLGQVWLWGRCRISPPRFLAECCRRVVLFCCILGCLFFSDLYCVCLSVFSCTVLFVSISQVIGCEDRLRNDLYCVEWGRKLYSNQPTCWDKQAPYYFRLPVNAPSSHLYMHDMLVYLQSTLQQQRPRSLQAISLWRSCTPERRRLRK